MIWSAVAHVFSVLLELFHISRMSNMDKDLEILVLRYQLGIADRKHPGLNPHLHQRRLEPILLRHHRSFRLLG
jgi:hypothetical protein